MIVVMSYSIISGERSVTVFNGSSLDPLRAVLNITSNNNVFTPGY